MGTLSLFNQQGQKLIDLEHVEKNINMDNQYIQKGKDIKVVAYASIYTYHNPDIELSEDNVATITAFFGSSELVRLVSGVFFDGGGYSSPTLKYKINGTKGVLTSQFYGECEQFLTVIERTI